MPDSRHERASGLHRQTTRRGFLKGVVTVTGGLIAAATVGPQIAQEAKTAFLRGIEEPLEHRVGQPIEDRQPETIVTSGVLGNPNIRPDQIPVRSEPRQSDQDIIGFTKPDIVIKGAIPYYGVVFSTKVPGATIRGEKGTYGLWYKVTTQVYDKNGQPQLVEGFIAANFTRQPTAQELKTIK